MVWQQWFSIASVAVLLLTAIAIFAFNFRKDKEADFNAYLQGVGLFDLIIYGICFIVARILTWMST